MHKAVFILREGRVEPHSLRKSDHIRDGFFSPVFAVHYAWGSKSPAPTLSPSLCRGLGFGTPSVNLHVRGDNKVILLEM